MEFKQGDYMINSLKIIGGIIIPGFIVAIITILLTELYIDDSITSWLIFLFVGFAMAYFGKRYTNWFVKKFCKGRIE